MTDYKKIEDYGIIGDLDTCALVGKDGSIDWCCFPHIESFSIFASILDIEKGGHFVVQPSEHFESEQKYMGNTNVLQTIFQTSLGTATLIDFMLLKEKDKVENIAPAICRKVICSDGVINVNYPTLTDGASCESSQPLRETFVLRSAVCRSSSPFEDGPSI